MIQIIRASNGHNIKALFKKYNSKQLLTLVKLVTQEQGEFFNTSNTVWI